jgi:hypothetical protein
VANLPFASLENRTNHWDSIEAIFLQTIFIARHGVLLKYISFLVFQILHIAAAFIELVVMWDLLQRQSLAIDSKETVVCLDPISAQTTLATMHSKNKCKMVLGSESTG